MAAVRDLDVFCVGFNA